MTRVLGEGRISGSQRGSSICLIPSKTTVAICKLFTVRKLSPVVHSLSLSTRCSYFCFECEVNGSLRSARLRSRSGFVAQLFADIRARRTHSRKTFICDITQPLQLKPGHGDGPDLYQAGHAKSESTRARCHPKIFGNPFECRSREQRRSRADVWCSLRPCSRRRRSEFLQMKASAKRNAQSLFYLHVRCVLEQDGSPFPRLPFHLSPPLSRLQRCGTLV